MTSWECYENKWFYTKYKGKYLSKEMSITYPGLDTIICSQVQ